MTILFPSDSIHLRSVERDFSPEAQAAQQAGLDAVLLDFDALTQGDMARALRLVPPIEDLEQPQALVYRGWMIRSALYASLFEALLQRGRRLLNEPRPYALCHELPGWYALLEGRTPRSRWLPAPECFDRARVLAAAAEFGSQPLVIKDYVKSRKHEWQDACFIADAGDAREVERVTVNFLGRQAQSLVGGLVLRQFVPLRAVESGAKLGAPIVNEWRLFWLDHALLACAPNGAPGGEEPSPQVLEGFQELAARIPSRFFAMDIAQKAEGDWIIIELGDGGVSGLPDHLDAAEFYSALHQAITQA